MTYPLGLPVLIVDYGRIVYFPTEEIELALQAIHMWADWFPGHFIILAGFEDND